MKVLCRVPFYCSQGLTRCHIGACCQVKSDADPGEA
jgi:hypothetical protein